MRVVRERGWDKREQDGKWMDATGKADSDLVTRIQPDVVAHIVGKRKNLLVVEKKRSANRNRKALARDILTRQEGDYGCAVGVHLIVDITRSVITGCNAYINGAIDDHSTGWLMGATSIDPVFAALRVIGQMHLQNHSLLTEAP